MHYGIRIPKVIAFIQQWNKFVPFLIELLLLKHQLSKNLIIY